MKRFFPVLLLVLVFALSSYAQKKGSIYNPKANAEADIQAAVIRAAKEHKQVFVQVGGDWCIWCVRFHTLIESVDSLRRLMEDNYVTVHVNYSPENHNEKLLESLGKPQRFGFPVFVILNEKGERIHTQNTAELEEKGSIWHSRKKVAEMLRKWAVPADSNSLRW